MGLLVRRSLAVRLAFSAAAGLFALLMGSGGAFACPQIIYNACGNNNQYCFKGYFHNGGIYDLGGPLWPEESDATISAYNPSPVWSSSAVYTALHNDSPTRCGSTACIAQIGWIHWYNCQAGNFSGSNGCNSDGLEHVFVEWTTNSGSYSPIYYYNQPSGTETYIVYRWVCSGCNNSYTLYWKEGSVSPPSTVNWGPNGGEYVTEVHDADTGAGWHGSQVPGNASSKVSFSSDVYHDQYGTIHTPSLTSENGDPYGSISWGSGADFTIYDIRCP